ncbi:PD-(D/E)XK nuclease family protein, partial [Burkholderia cenocepacia]|uniref:PD-(D/E)XK nuclease family protein n=1 Tax=Burkholderia cenocepacia TaxID=95486 RepID=UPI0038CC0EC1
MSPTGFESLLRCARAFAYQRDPSTKSWVRGGTRTALGTVAHRLTERVMIGDAPVDGTRAWLEQTWSSLLEDHREALRSEWPGASLPPTRDWPGVTATRVRLLQRLMRDRPEGSRHKPAVQRRAAESHASRGEQPPPRLPWIERTLRDSTISLVGAPDRVEESGGRIRVVDLKSGIGPEYVADRHRRQLLLYAHLVHVTLGRPVNDLLLLDLRGD